jgi:hypothetical protein
MAGRLSGVYLFECRKGFEQAIEHLRMLAKDVLDAYAKANPKKRPLYPF